jgi:RND superfamily putative drug exporter
MIETPLPSRLAAMHDQPLGGDTMRKPRNLAASAGRWSAQHRKTAIIGWILFVVLAFGAGQVAGTQELTDAESGVGQSGQATKLVDGAYPKKIHEAVLIQSKALKADAPAYRAVVNDVTKRVGEVKTVTEITGPYGSGSTRGPTSKDGHSVLVSFEIPGDYAEDSLTLTPIVDETVAATEAAQKAHPDFNIEQFGDASSEAAFEEVFMSDLQKSGLTSVPVTLIILFVAFGTMLLAGMPVLLALTAIAATMGLVGPISQLAPVEDSINHVILLIGLAVGVDYTLFYLRRVREERAAGRTHDAAIEAAAATSGRAVLVSGLTVMASMAGMYFAGVPMFAGLATGTIAVVAVAMLGSLTVLPALLASAGDRVVKQGRVPGLARLKARAARFGLWSRVTDRVLKRPALSASLAVGLLVAMAVPALHMQTGEPSVDTLPKDLAIVQTFERLDDAFPSETGGLDLVLKADDVTAPAVTAGIARLEQAMAKQPELFPDTNVEVDVSPSKTIATVSFATAGNGSDDASHEALDVVRDDLVPQTIGAVAGVETYVGGNTAEAQDFNDTLRSNIGLVFGFVMLAAFVLLLVTFRSIVIPIKAIILNLLSVFASYGVMTLVFQHGWFKSLLGFSETGPIVQWLPLFMFVILFGLSMDYHVFILSRVREAYDKGMSTGDAVSYAIKNTAGVVTSAALVMVCVFAVFGTLSWMMFKQMGVGLAFAILLDATLIRGVLLPASMKLLGDWNWWLPRSLRWLPEVKHEGEVLPAQA